MLSLLTFLHVRGSHERIGDYGLWRLLVPGLRRLAPDDPEYRPLYGGNPHDRDSAYHQGTVWGWLLGQFLIALEG